MDYRKMVEELFLAPARGWVAQSPEAPMQRLKNEGGLLGELAYSLDPVSAFGGYGGLAAMALPPGASGRLPTKVMRLQDVDAKPFAVHVNPSPRKAHDLAKNSQSGFVRTFGDDDGNLYMWTGDAAFDHGLLMEQIGAKDYAGAGVAKSPFEAFDWAERFRR